MRHLALWNDVATLSPWRGFFDQAFDEETYFQPACELEETDSHYVLNVDVPGIPKKDIQIEFKDNQLYVSGERKSEKKGATFSERSYGKFQRVFTLPKDVNSEKIEARYVDGVLTLEIPKAESAKPRLIKIADGSTH